MSKGLIEQLRSKTIRPFDLDPVADFIEAQQSWIASLEQNASDADRMYKELETELAEQQKRIAELEAERDTEIARNRPLRSLIASLEEQKSIWNKKKTAATEAVKTLDSEREANALLTEQLTAAQAQIKVLRDALESIGNGFHESHQVHAVIKHALNQFADDSALRELLKAEREACAKVCEKEAADPHNVPAAIVARRCAESIRAMEDQ